MDLFGRLSSGGKNLADKRTPDGQPGAHQYWGWAGPPTGASCTTVLPPIPMGSHGAKRKNGSGGMRSKKMGRLRCAGLHCDETAQRPSEAGRGGHGCAARRSFHHAAGRHGLALRASGSRGRPAADTLRAGRVAGHQSALQAADEPGVQILGGLGTSWRKWATRSSPTC